MDDNKYPSSIWMNYDMEWDRNYFTFFHVDSGNDIEYSVEYIRKDEHDRIVADVRREYVERIKALRKKHNLPRYDFDVG